MSQPSATSLDRKARGTRRLGKVDVVVIVPLLEEFLAVQKHIAFEPVEEEACPPILPTLYEAKLGKLHLVACILHEMANEYSALVTERCITHFDPSLVVGIGIAGGLHKDVALGDVIFSRGVKNFMFESKIVAKEGGGNLLQPSAHGYLSVGHALLDYAKNFESTHSETFRNWQLEGKREREALGLPTRSTRGKQTSDSAGGEVKLAGDAPAFIVEAIASGPSVAASTAYVAELRAIARDYAAIEMEGAGIALACLTRGHEDRSFFLLRGVSDFADQEKSKLEEVSGGKWRLLAANNAARMLRAMLEDPELMTRSHAVVDAQIKPGKRLLRIVVLFNDAVHYVSSINEGFRSQLRKLVGSRFEVSIADGYGSPEQEALDANQAKVKALVAQFGDDAPDYVVTIGTAVTMAAIGALDRRDRLLFMGVSDPEALKLDKLPKAGRPIITGVRYGLPIDQTIAVLHRLFPQLTPVFVYSGNRYAQDATLCEHIVTHHAATVEVLNLPGPGVLPHNGAGKIFFGRFFFCSNMSTFHAHNPGVPLVGVSKENVGFGATVSIGYEPHAIGTLGAEALANDLLTHQKFEDGRVLHPSVPMLAISRSRLEALGITEIPEELKNFSIFDVR